ncbi:MAG TPA: HTH domain-containing protein [Anaerolineae bacterium]|nr:HTH domain-containing protein [Anaerolineae bacterium]
MKRAVRLMAMRDLLSERPVTVSELARRFGVSARTVYYDLQDLQLAPIEFPVGTLQIWAAQCVLAQLCR